MMNRVLLSVAFPIIILLGWTIQLDRGSAGPIQVRLPVIGYDPRDLLAGHYVLFQPDFRRTDICDGAEVGQERCVCLERLSSETLSVGGWAGECGQRPLDTCLSKFIRGSCEHGRFITGLDRYFIPEQLAPVLQQIPENSSINVSLDAEGGAQVTAMYVGEQTVEDYARARLAEKATSSP